MKSTVGMIKENTLFHIDAFAGRLFEGNPAAVCLLKTEPSTKWMQSMAAEMNLSETAFVWSEGERLRLRWFTPTVEVPLCGHATLASVYALYLAKVLPSEQKVFFETLSGTLTGTVQNDNYIELDFPAEPPTATEVPSDLASACGIQSKPLYTGKNRLGFLFEISSEDEVRTLIPDFSALKLFGGIKIMITAKANAGSKYDFVSRFFAPGFGIPEDPVTGAMHCCVGPYWAKALNKTELFVYQASARGGEMGVSIQGKRVILSGQAHCLFQANLSIDS